MWERIPARIVTAASWAKRVSARTCLPLTCDGPQSCKNDKYQIPLSSLDERDPLHPHTDGMVAVSYPVSDLVPNHIGAG